MPTPTQIRAERVQTLFKWANDNNVKLIDDIIKKAYELYPTLSEHTAKELARSAFRILEDKRRKEK